MLVPFLSLVFAYFYKNCIVYHNNVSNLTHVIVFVENLLMHHEARPFSRRHQTDFMVGGEWRGGSFSSHKAIAVFAVLKVGTGWAFSLPLGRIRHKNTYIYIRVAMAPFFNAACACARECGGARHRRPKSAL